MIAESPEKEYDPSDLLSIPGNITIHTAQQKAAPWHQVRSLTPRSTTGLKRPIHQHANHRPNKRPTVGTTLYGSRIVSR